jgi:hypothetical protein
VTNDYFRFGASSLLMDIERQVCPRVDEGEARGTGGFPGHIPGAFSPRLHSTCPFPPCHSASPLCLPLAVPPRHGGVCLRPLHADGGQRARWLLTTPTRGPRRGPPWGWLPGCRCALGVRVPAPTAAPRGATGKLSRRGGGVYFCTPPRQGAAGPGARSRVTWIVVLPMSYGDGLCAPAPAAS